MEIYRRRPARVQNRSGAAAQELNQCQTSRSSTAAFFLGMRRTFPSMIGDSNSETPSTKSFGPIEEVRSSLLLILLGWIGVQENSRFANHIPDSNGRGGFSKDSAWPDIKMPRSTFSLPGEWLPVSIVSPPIFSRRSS